ncbi:MAG: tetratricopeptide repeat protein [Phycisphaerales bacterium]|nr:tetratricopeptide repeat protein [Phycisphaerales bacterium]
MLVKPEINAVARSAQRPAHRFAAPLAATCVVLGVVTVLAGCASAKKPASAEVTLPQYDTQTATRLAAQGLQAQRAGRLDAAIELYQKAINAHPELSGIWTNLGVALMAKNDFTTAAEAFKKAADLSPTDSRPLVNLGVAYLDRGWADESLTWFGRALERDPNNIDALRGAIVAAQRSGNEDDKTLNRIKALQLIETDPKWNQELGFRRARIEANLKERGKTGAALGAQGVTPARSGN